eukprot:9074049-Alexandrium_andersonii.AAC.1
MGGSTWAPALPAVSCAFPENCPPGPPAAPWEGPPPLDHPKQVPPVRAPRGAAVAPPRDQRGRPGGSSPPGRRRKLQE